MMVDCELKHRKGGQAAQTVVNKSTSDTPNENGGNSKKASPELTPDVLEIHAKYYELIKNYPMDVLQAAVKANRSYQLWLNIRKTVIITTIIVAICGGLYALEYNEVLHEGMVTHLRKALLHYFPKFMKSMSVQDNKCLIYNSNYVPHLLSEEDCTNGCKSVSNVVELDYNETGIDRADFYSDFLMNDRPVVVKNVRDYAIQSPPRPIKEAWKNLSHFQQFVNSHEVYKKPFRCPVNSISKRKYPFLSEYLNIDPKNEDKPFFIEIENCKLEFAKPIRAYYGRPTFLPLNTVVAKMNNVILSRNIKNVEWMNIAIQTQFVLVHQQKGMIHFRLQPRAECLSETLCSKTSVQTLFAGDILLVPSTVWHLLVKPATSSDQPFSVTIITHIEIPN